MRHLSFIITNAVLCSICAASILGGCQSPDAGKSSGAAADSTYTLTGKIEGIDTGWAYLRHRQSEEKNIDSARIKDGEFVIRGRSTAPEFVNIGFLEGGKRNFHAGLFLQNGALTLKGKKDSLSDAALAITGSLTENEFQQFQQGQKPFDSVMHVLGTAYDSAEKKADKVQKQDSIMQLIKGNSKDRTKAIKDFVAAHPSSYVSAFEVDYYFSYNPDPAELDSLYNGLDSSVKISYYGEKVSETLGYAKKTAPGSVAPNFTQNDTAGKPVSLSSFKGKYVLVDFWASWCGPCRRENPAVLKAYKKYHPKGFTVLGVSLDDDKDKWLEAIKEDKLGWAQVSDLKGWKNSAARLYGINGIPMNFLLDKDGKIVAKGLRGDDLEKKLYLTIDK
ncbi:MAG TPA: TlpA disulfide reductase family protein [Puia sp.]|nr:TlpA disulfide reductase family protein [Puia sp.]